MAENKYTPELAAKKSCSKCGKEHSLDYFFKNSTTLDGKSCWCKSCYREYQKRYVRSADGKARANEQARQRYQNNPDGYKERSRKYAELHKDRIKQYQRDYRKQHPDYFKQYYLNHQDELRTYGREYGKTYRLTPTGRLRVRTNELRRRQREQQAGGRFTAHDLRTLVHAQTDRKGVLRCWWCGGPIENGYHLDHVIPLIKGGSNDPRNIVVSHGFCNLSKHDSLPSEFAGRLF